MAYLALESLNCGSQICPLPQALGLCGPNLALPYHHHSPPAYIELFNCKLTQCMIEKCSINKDDCKILLLK